MSDYRENRRRDIRFTESHTADAVWLFLPIQKRGLYRFPLFLGKENDYEMSLLQQP